jgi:hypothetical protein
MKNTLLAVLAIVIVVAVVLGVRTYGARNETDSVSTNDASKLVGGEQQDDQGGSKVDPGARPDPGTYTYKGAGSDKVSLLGGSEHVFPSTIPVVVELDGDTAKDCGWTWNLIYVKQHVEERNYCTDESTVLDAGFTRTIEFFGQTQKAHYACGDDAVRLRRDAKAGDTWSWKCENEDGNAVGTYTLTVLAPAKLTIDGESINAIHTRVTQKQSGDTNGTGTDEYWLAPTGLPLRFDGSLDVTTKSVLGTTKFTEREHYELTSLNPKQTADSDA